MATFIAATKFTAIDKFSSPIRKMSSNVRKFGQRAETSIARADRAFRKMTPGLGSATKQFLSFASAAAVTAAIIGGIAFSTKALIDYEDSLASLQAITGVTNEVFAGFKTQIGIVAGSTKKSAVEVAQAFEIVGSAKPELLTSAEALGKVTKAAIILSKATKEDLGVSARSLTGILNQFGLEAEESTRIINALAAGSKAGAAAVPLISQAIDKFGTAAASLNISVEESVGLVETLAEKSIFGAEAGTNLRNILIKMATIKALPKDALDQLAKFGVNTNIVSDNTLSLSVRLTELSKIQNDATALTKVFGKENFIAGQILLQNVESVDSFTKAVTGTNTALEQADLNSNTFSNRLKELQNAWVNIITKNESANGLMGAFKNVLVFVADNLKTIVKGIALTVGAFVALKIILIVSKAVLIGYNIILGITTAIQGKSAIALRTSTIALKAYTFATRVASIAQAALNVIMSLNPVGLIIISIVALIALLAVIVNKWNSWGAALAIFLGPLGLIISLIQSFRRNWDLIVSTFKTEGILAGFKKIGATILDAVLMPLQQVFELIAKLTGADFAVSAAAEIAQFREKLGINVTTDETGKEIIQPGVSLEQARTERFETTENQNIGITIKDETGRAEVNEGKGPVAIIMEPTFIFP
ncbi:MAG: phage tail tape measure protein [Candidatus Anammoxibacter sp.]